MFLKIVIKQDLKFLYFSFKNKKEIWERKRVKLFKIKFKLKKIYKQIWPSNINKHISTLINIHHWSFHYLSPSSKIKTLKYFKLWINLIFIKVNYQPTLINTFECSIHLCLFLTPLFFVENHFSKPWKPWREGSQRWIRIQWCKFWSAIILQTRNQPPTTHFLSLWHRPYIYLPHSKVTYCQWIKVPYLCPEFLGQSFHRNEALPELIICLSDIVYNASHHIIKM